MKPNRIRPVIPVITIITVIIVSIIIPILGDYGKISVPSLKNTQVQCNAIDVLFNTTWGYDDSDYPMDLITVNDDIYIVGGSNNELFGGCGGRDAVLIKLNSSGYQEWNVSWGGPGYDAGMIITRYQENLYVMSTLENETSGDDYALLSNFDMDGNEIWNSSFSNPAYSSFIPYNMEVVNGELCVSWWWSDSSPNGGNGYLSKFYLNGTIKNATCLNMLTRPPRDFCVVNQTLFIVAQGQVAFSEIHLYKWDAVTETTNWVLETESKHFTSPRIINHDSFLYIYGSDAISKLDLDGNQIWNKSICINNSVPTNYHDIEFLNGYLYVSYQYGNSSKNSFQVTKLDDNGNIISNFTYYNGNLHSYPSHISSLGDDIVAAGSKNDTGGIINIFATRYHDNQTSPSVYFTSNVTKALPGQDIQFTFTGTCEDAPATFSWDFNGEVASSDENPVVSFGTLGLKNVTLVVTDVDGHANNKTVSALIEVVSDVPAVANGSCNTTSIVECQAIQFWSAGSEGNAPLEFYWDFGDGSPVNTSQDPVHVYSIPGTYPVVLNVTDGLGENDSFTLPGNITVAGDLPVNASFTANLSAGETIIDALVSFTHVGSPGNLPSNYTWDFGDGSPASHDPSPIHSYSSGGCYNVTLTVVDLNGDVNSVTMVDFVTVLQDTVPVADFMVSTARPVTGKDVSFSFNGSSAQAIVSYQWDFNDSSGNGSGPGVSHVYTPGGTYNVTLTVVDSNGNSSSRTRVVAVEVNGLPTCNFNVLTLYPVTGKDVSFLFNGSWVQPIVDFQWDFGDGVGNGTGSNPSHVYGSGSTFTIRLTVTDVDGDSSSISRNITVVADLKPTASFSASRDRILPGMPVTFQHDGLNGNGLVSYAWTVNSSGSTVLSTNNQLAGFSFDAPGDYNVTLVVTDVDGDAQSWSLIVTVQPRQNPAVPIAIGASCAAGVAVVSMLLAKRGKEPRMDALLGKVPSGGEVKGITPALEEEVKGAGKGSVVGTDISGEFLLWESCITCNDGKEESIIARLDEVEEVRVGGNLLLLSMRDGTTTRIVLKEIGGVARWNDLLQELLGRK
ncbi:MAG: PKD domain-containing protein [Promethearchaeota archaeon]